ncbi:acyl-CoA dehydrogenase family protein [Desulfotomaculum copahuensis]|uniref:Acyl-CoA dehydrogenase n=1 Tax=Desulfotomaculum copahuensis TaxID=1838280 RepID=A0A1B7LFL0_9FIRM|nr:acyl-CoA dehydrogenase family protein [Desulfotomaculum copahuensis]OAT82343.1 acyl-CoA dehydrogenase [Desulfotomaculum copahuensis]
MSLPDRDNPYSFDYFLARRNSFDFYRDDPFLQQTVKRYARVGWESLHENLLAFSPRVSFRWKELADTIARPEARPYILHYDAHNHRIDRIVRPFETHLLEKEIFSLGLFSERTTVWEQFTKRFLLNQIGEAGVMCPLACTEGLIALIENFPDHGIPELNNILTHCKEGIDGDFGIGAQFMSEIQGGSDIPANLIEAVPDGKTYRLYGNKFFCSAMQADYAVVTAKVTGSEKVGTFVVPSWLPGDKAGERRNGYVINRLKWKMGTVELPTAEVDYRGAVAYAVGPVDRGVANAVGIVLTLSRIAVGVSSAAAMLRAAREALMYSRFRDVFGFKIDRFPMAARQVAELVETAKRSTAGAFKLYDLFVRLGRKLQPGLNSAEPLEMRKKRFNLRELILLQKVVTASDAVDVIRKAMSIFGGHGVMEEFSSLPRLFRDAAVNELWEGPRNVLLTQVFRDLQRASEWYDPAEFVAGILEAAPQDKVNYFSSQIKEILAKQILVPGKEAMDAAGRWEDLCHSLFLAYQEQALAEVGAADILC